MITAHTDYRVLPPEVNAQAAIVAAAEPTIRFATEEGVPVLSPPSITRLLARASCFGKGLDNLQMFP